MNKQKIQLQLENLTWKCYLHMRKNNMESYSQRCFISGMQNIARFLILELYFISFTQVNEGDFENIKWVKQNSHYKNGCNENIYNPVVDQE